MLSTSKMLTQSRFWDRLGIGLSALCLIHCLVLPVAFTWLSVWFSSGSVHKWMAGILLVTALMATLPGYQTHGRTIVLWFFAGGLSLLVAALWIPVSVGSAAHVSLTVLGSLTLITGHTLNWHYQRCSHKESRSVLRNTK